MELRAGSRADEQPRAPEDIAPLPAASWTIEVTKSLPLFSSSLSGEALRIESLDMLEQWNSKSAGSEQEIRLGDFVTSVNGVSGSAEDLKAAIEACEEGSNVEMTIQRQVVWMEAYSVMETGDTTCHVETLEGQFTELDVDDAAGAEAAADHTKGAAVCSFVQEALLESAAPPEPVAPEAPEAPAAIAVPDEAVVQLLEGALKPMKRAVSRIEEVLSKSATATPIAVKVPSEERGVRFKSDFQSTSHAWAEQGGEEHGGSVTSKHPKGRGLLVRSASSVVKECVAGVAGVAHAVEEVAHKVTTSRTDTLEEATTSRDDSVNLASLSPGARVSVAAKLHDSTLEHSLAVFSHDIDHPIIRYLHKKFPRLMRFFESLVEPSREGCVAAFVTSKAFEMLCTSIIMANAIFIIFTTNYEIQHPGEAMPSHMRTFERFLLIFYSVELALKLIVHRGYFFWNKEMYWNIFDLVLVAISNIEVLVAVIFGNGQGSSSSNAPLMRSLRILKMARVLRSLRAVRFVAQLRLILNSIAGSAVSLFWSMVMLALIYYIFGLIFVQGTATYFALNLGPNSSEVFEENREGLLEFFGSVETGMLTLYKASTGGDDWVNFFEVLQPTGDLNAALFIFFMAFITIALWNILTGVFVDNAMKLAMPDEEDQIRESLNKEKSSAEHLRALFTDVLGFDAEEKMSEENFVDHWGEGNVRMHMALNGLDVKDPSMFFHTLKDLVGAEEISQDEFVEACMRMRGTASCVDVHFLLSGQRTIHEKLYDFQKKLLFALDHVHVQVMERL